MGQCGGGGGGAGVEKLSIRTQRGPNEAGLEVGFRLHNQEGCSP